MVIIMNMDLALITILFNQGLCRGSASSSDMNKRHFLVTLSMFDMNKRHFLVTLSMLTTYKSCTPGNAPRNITIVIHVSGAVRD